MRVKATNGGINSVNKVEFMKNILRFLALRMNLKIASFVNVSKNKYDCIIINMYFC